MRCSNCKTENPPDKKFCGDCGAALANLCPKCVAENPAGKRFCGECGAALGATAAASIRKSNDSPIRVADSPASENLDGERKTVTALFADIKGSTELEQDLDPEEARAIVDPALKLMIDAVRRYDGYVVQSTGDGIFALFGAPLAHEDHPQRALYAALRMQEELRRYSARLRETGNLPLEVRVGVNTGEVVIRSIATGDGQTEYTPIGHTTNLASRMQALAPTGSTAISEQTRKLVEGYFALKPLGPTKVKGVSEPVNVYEVTGLGPLRTRLQRSAGRGYTKFVGRNHEMEAMKAAAERAKAGHGQIVAAMAEAGVGKSRLLHEFKATSQSGWMVLETFSVSYGKASAYLPVIGLLHSYFEISSDDDARKRREKVAGRLAILDPSLEGTRPYLFSLLGIIEGDEYNRHHWEQSLDRLDEYLHELQNKDPLAQMDAQIKKRRTLDAIKRILIRESLNQPLMVIFEDLHWIDDETQALLNLLADSIGTARILLLVNYRPEYRHEWGNKTYYTQLRLDPLGKKNAAEMLQSLLGDSAELDPLKRMIVEKTEGNPFFIEEMVQTLFEDGALARNGTVSLTSPLSDLKIPATVQGILAARIDRLPPAEKELLQTLSVIGKDFQLGLVRAVTGSPDDRLQAMIDDLQVAEFVYERPSAGDFEYTFKHALTQQVAYQSVLIEKRKLLHQRTAQIIESLFADRIDDHVAELARHYGHSDDPMKAAHYLILSATQAQGRSAYTQATELARCGIAILAGTAEGPQRDRAEIGLQLILAQSLSPVFSPGFAEVGRTYTRVIELCRRTEDERQLFAALGGLCLHYQITSDTRRERELSGQLLALAVRLGDSAMVGIAHARVAAALWLLGQPEAARAHGEESLAVPGPEDQFGPTFPRLADAYPALACSLWLLGFPDRARKAADELISSAQSLKNPLAAIISLTQSWDLNRFLRDAVRTREHAEAAIAIGSEYGIRPLELAAMGHRAWGLVHEDRANAGLEEIHRWMDGRWVQSRKKLGIGSRPSVLAMLVEAHLEMKQPAAGLQALEEAFSRVEPTGERMYESELHRLQGDLLLMQDASSNIAQAGQSYRTAIDVARAQSAKSWELRATTSLARLLGRQGKRAEACAMLADVYNWFTEGFDTADLKDAKALLEELNNSRR